MPRFFWLPIFVSLAFIPLHMAQAALPPEAQQYKEKDAVLNSDELQGKTIYSIRSLRGADSTTYLVEADCSYTFEITYTRNWRVLFGWVGPQMFDVNMIGEPNCPQRPEPNIDKKAFDQVILDAVATVYLMPAVTLENSTRLYGAPATPRQQGMDFRIIKLRAFLEDRVGCRMDTNAYAKIRTVGDLLNATNLHCNKAP